MLLRRVRTHALRLRLVYFMRRFLFLTLFTALLISTVAKAETWYLLAAGRNSLSTEASSSTWTVPMANEELCEAAGKKLINDIGWGFKEGKYVFAPHPNGAKTHSMHYTCVKSK